MSVIGGRSPHLFARARPSAEGDASLTMEPVRNTSYRDLPSPTGTAPFRLDLKDIISQKAYDEIINRSSLTLHLNGDTGGIQYAVPQELVARGMEADLSSHTNGEAPSFLYITGDCVYFNGSTSQYYAQFYQPYEFYAAPIFAVAGNHDGENLPGEGSLVGFVRNFCAHEATILPEAGESHRTTMTQPNVYWTLITPVAWIIGLYSNVPEGGEVREPQLTWLAEEIRAAPLDLPIVVALHHPIYSADDHHSGSAHMKKVLQDATAQAGRHPDLVVAGHVHNYQRITKYNAKGQAFPYIVAGGGGYHNLHSIMKVGGQKMVAPVSFNVDGEQVTLEKYIDDHHGFMRLKLTPSMISGRYYQVPRPQDPYSKRNELMDYFNYDLKARRYVPNHL